MARWLPLVLVGLLAVGFAYFNGAERVTVHLGVTAFYGVPLSIVVFIAFLLGMIVMFGVGIRQDLRIRRALRESGMIDDAASTRGSRRAASLPGDDVARPSYAPEEERAAPRPP